MAALGKKMDGVIGQEPAVRETHQDGGLSASLLAMLKVEDEARGAESLPELQVLIANELMRLNGARQVFVFKCGIRRLEVAAVSSLSSFDRNAPLVQAIEAIIEKLAREAGAGKPHEFEASAYAGANDSILRTYPFRWLMWVPLAARNDRQLGGVLLARETAWGKSDGVVTSRLARVFSHCWAALEGTGQARRSAFVTRRTAGLAIVAVTALLMLPVAMTTLAPFEIGSKDEFIIAAPLDGVIDAVDVEPNAAVKKDQVLVRFSDTVLRNRLEVAEREVAVADARLVKTQQLAFADIRGRHDISIARAELALRSSERDYARDLLQKAEIRSSRDGLAVFTDKRELIGKPVATGERILHIANPEMTEVRIDVPVSDALILRKDARVKIFLDSDPLRPRESLVRHADYLARVGPGDVLAFRVVADLVSDGAALPRLGARGTAQLYGETVPLAFYLFRRPLSALRQRIGL